MCGIVGYLRKSGNSGRTLGRTLLGMLSALGCRGPDSVGVALFGEPIDGQVLQIKLPEHSSPPSQCARIIEEHLRQLGSLRVAESTVTGSYLRLVVQGEIDVSLLCESIESVADDVEVISCGRRLEILKQVGSPAALESAYKISARTGTHGIGHTRLSTESRVDLSHSQPFWAHNLPDIATVHNGHVTNYHRLRRMYSQLGYRFYTENDSEVIGIYLRHEMSRGQTFEEALTQSITDFDGSFTYLAATEDSIAYVKDRFGFKPLVLAETTEFVAMATEEVALRSEFSGAYRTIEPPPGTVRIWHAPQLVAT